MPSLYLWPWALLALSAVASARPSETPPNIVLIMADDLGFEAIGANGGSSYETPRIDELAATGLRFEHAYAQPMCTPSRVKLMTGRSNVRNFRTNNLERDETTFAQLLHSAGYATCVAGKWRLTNGLEDPGHFGFDEYCLWKLSRTTERYDAPGLEINGKEVDHGADAYGPDVVSDYLCDFITRNRERPFLAYYPMILTHWPFHPTPDSDADRGLAYSNERGDPAHFADMVAYMDGLVGKLLDHLDELGLRENTLVLYTSDNGAHPDVQSRLGDRVVFGGKGLTTDAGTRVPLVASWPGTIEPGRTTADLVDLSDFLPTLCDVAGVATEGLDLDGRSFAPQLRGEVGQPREWIYSWFMTGPGPCREFARDERYKLYRSGEFYDVQEDPWESNALAVPDEGSDLHATHARLEQVLDQFRDASRDAVRAKLKYRERARR